MKPEAAELCITWEAFDLLHCYFEQVMAFAGKQRPVKIMISGAPASGKGTQCELITNKVTFTCLLSLSHSIFIVCVPVVIFVNPRTRGPARLENCLLICYASIDISIP